MDTSVKYFHSGMAGAPVMSGTVGSLLAVLDACLVNGFGLKTVNSLVVSNNVATATINTGHSAEVDTVVEIAGATPAALNGQWKVTAVSGNNVSWETSGIANQTATGTISLKLAGAGWVKEFSGANLGAYRSPNILGTRMYLRVDDTATTAARVIGYETMSDINTGTGLFPTTTQLNGGLYWSKSSAADSTRREWMLIADDRMFYFARSNVLGVLESYETGVFGDFISAKSGDAYACVINGTSANNAGSAISVDTYPVGFSNGVSAGLYAAKSYTGIGSAVQLGKNFPIITGNSYQNISGFVAGGIAFPNPQDGGVYIVPHYLLEFSPNSIRGVSPGFYCSPQAFTSTVFPARETITGVTAFPNKKFKSIPLRINPGIGTPCFVDITGPWR